jgi:hypothetical protein
MPDNMAGAPDGKVDNPIRRQIAISCTDRARSIGDVARELGKPDGAIRPTFHRMLREGILVEADLPDRRAQGYILAPAWKSADLQSPTANPGQLERGGRLVRVRGQLDILTVGLGEVSDEPGFLWAARVDNQEFLVFLAGREDEIDDAHIRLQRRGLVVDPAGDVGRLFDARQLREWASRLDRDRVPFADSRVADARHGLEGGPEGEGS